jgi:hypothetical protein
MTDRLLRRSVRTSEVGVSDQASEQSPESRVPVAGYMPSMGLGWLSPDGTRVVSLEQAIREVEGQWQQEGAR